MSSSTNYAKMPSWLHECLDESDNIKVLSDDVAERYTIKEFSKFDVLFRMHIVEEFRKEWATEVRDTYGNLLDLQSEQVAKDIQEGVIKPIVEWVKTDNVLEKSYTSHVEVVDKALEQHGPQQLRVFLSIEGPIMGIWTSMGGDGVYTIFDPCLVQYDGKRVSHHPIFNVARSIELNKEAVRSHMAPAEILVASYPGFMIQNRMMKYQLKPLMPMAMTPEVGTEAETVVEVDPENG